MKRLLAILSSSAFLAACGGSIPPPSERLAQAESASRSASELGAPNEPQAALHLKMAQDQIEQAKRLMQKDDNIRADALLQRARADAELALQLAKEAKTRADANAAAANTSAQGAKK